jgi:hypothetical protein
MPEGKKHVVDNTAAFPYVHPLESAAGGWQGHRVASGLSKLECLAVIILSAERGVGQINERDVNTALRLAAMLIRKAEEMGDPLEKEASREKPNCMAGKILGTEISHGMISGTLRIRLPDLKGTEYVVITCELVNDSGEVLVAYPQAELWGDASYNIEGGRYPFTITG